MRRPIFITALAALALAVSGCGTTQHAATARTTSRLHTHFLPRWLTGVIGRESRRFDARLAHGYPGNGQLITHSNGAILLTLWGEYTNPTTPSRHGNSLQLVIS